jgi:hypothetical protein
MWRNIALAAILISTAAYADLKVELPADMTPAKSQSNSGAGTHYVLPSGQVAVGKIVLADGRVLIPLDLTWYAGGEYGKEPYSDDDLQEIKKILTVPSFYNQTRILHLAGDKDRVTALMELVRDEQFHAGGSNVIWRAEIWYFEFENGGWAKVNQQSKVLDRQRFKDRQEYESYVAKQRWVRKLARTDGQVKLESGDVIASTRPK